ncbi:MAG: UDP-N-acetylmuramate dehydrogenase [Clostridia bacterium]|nr:UDP-N-acetylmuramate dehydrogenase [Clostridia bacterium]
MDSKIKEKLIQIVGEQDVISPADMRSYTSFKAGGEAEILVKVNTVHELKSVLSFLTEENVKHMFLGNGSNTLFKDSGYHGVVIKLDDAFGYIENKGGGIIEAGAQSLMSSVGRFAYNEGLSGFEFASGIPGSIGGGVFMNAGAYGGELKDILISARVISYDGKEDKLMTASELDLGYRHSALAESGGIVVSARFKLQAGNKEEIKATMDDLAFKRTSKQPLQYPSAGSFFKRPEGYFAGKLIQDAGLKGYTVGGAQVSELHSGFVINIGGATETDISNLMHHVQAEVKKQFGVDLEPEIRIIGD